jgi:pimeloyl-ACP methyl ester carboxylesterase
VATRAKDVDAGSRLDVYGTVGRPEWMDVDWPQYLRWVAVNGRRVNVLEIGDGPPLLFVHGLSGCWQNWLENIPFFARDHRVIAVDLPGFGESEMPAEDISMSAYAATIDALLDELGVDAVRLVGNSMGGFVGAELAIRYPARVERLVLVSAAGISLDKIRTQRTHGLRHRAENVAFFSLGWLATQTNAVTGRPKLREHLLRLVAAHPARLSAPLIAEQVAGTGKPGFIPALDAMLSYPLRDRLEQIACPTFIVWGDKDLLVPVRDASEFERLIPDSRKAVYEDTGHVPMFERPARFNADVHAFLQEQPGEEEPAPQPRTFAT